MTRQQILASLTGLGVLLELHLTAAACLCYLTGALLCAALSGPDP